ncbi:hypothetical protein [Paenibacillus flagellatus]|uniref:Uncharacterized protein n=1 Tax=Paenibacillus flagellatus TaxID=2211139 RepID=A0A2V5K6Y3_9BACL|nr:hypothetical protein [Paenibacillus flagellatus]PYI55209.1 hypothetical protein DLM86_11845 [Paenibacillus flagellatus]
MPDWSYRTLFRPLLFAMPSRTARAVTLGAMGALSRLPGGTLLIKTLGHMDRYRDLESDRLGGLRTGYPVGLGGPVDAHGQAPAALAQFGFGYVEVGPVTPEPIAGGGPIVLDAEREELHYPVRHESDGIEAVLARERANAGKRRQPLLFRLRHMPQSDSRRAAAEVSGMVERTKELADGVILDTFDERWTEEEWFAAAEETIGAARRMLGEGAPVFVYVPLDMPDDRLESLLARRRERGRLDDGLVIGDTIRAGDLYAVGRSGLAPTRRKLRLIREYDAACPVIATGGVHEPAEAVTLVREGADYVQLHSGLVFAGPGLPKRINEAILHDAMRGKKPPEPETFWQGWGWMFLLGIGMIVGGVIAFLIAATTVVLPYDEAYLGAHRHELHEGNGNVLPFMSHDRITLAGTMVSIGILYAQFARHGLRRRLHWTKTALLVSGIVGFSSFFLYLGYGYFDPLHALAAAVLLPMFMLAMRREADDPPRTPANLRSDRLWRRAQWGQLMLVSLGFALALGGGVISIVGITHVFVPQDIDYIGATAEELSRINPRLVPLIAHDRAGFGGALLSDALALLAAALWGVRQGERWLWWTLLVGGLPGFAAGFGVHAAIGYGDFVHLLPAYFAFALFVAGLVLLYPYMTKPVPASEE